MIKREARFFRCYMLELREKKKLNVSKKNEDFVWTSPKMGRGRNVVIKGEKRNEVIECETRCLVWTNPTMGERKK